MNTFIAVVHLIFPKSQIEETGIIAFTAPNYAAFIHEFDIGLEQREAVCLDMQVIEIYRVLDDQEIADVIAYLVAQMTEQMDIAAPVDLLVDTWKRDNKNGRWN